MAAARQAIKAAPAEHTSNAAQPVVEASTGCEPVPSPALALQASLAETYAYAWAQEAPEPEVAKWPRWARGAFLLTAAASSWGLVVAGGALLRR